MSPMGFEPTISAGKLPQTYALDGAATGTGYARKLAYKPSRFTERADLPETIEQKAANSSKLV
jgi:hypothetical protein